MLNTNILKDISVGDFNAEFIRNIQHILKCVIKKNDTREQIR